MELQWFTQVVVWRNFDLAGRTHMCLIVQTLDRAYAFKSVTLDH